MVVAEHIGWSRWSRCCSSVNGTSLSEESGMENLAQYVSIGCIED